MADWSGPSRFQLEALHEALLFAYPTASDFNTLLVLRLGKSYDFLAPVKESYRNALLVILLQAQGEGWLDSLVRGALRHRPKSPKLLLLEQSFELTSVDGSTNAPPLEDIVRHEAGYQDLLPWTEKLVTLAQRTCRIECPVNSARGTGWLVGPDLLLTNWHVVREALPGGKRTGAEFVCRFDYALTPQGTRAGTEVGLAENWCLASSPPSQGELGNGAAPPNAGTLDFALLRLARPVGQEEIAAGRRRGWVDMRTNQAQPVEGEIVFVIQHPEGLPVKLAPGDVMEIAGHKLRFYHSANTSGGASGAIVVNAKLEPVGLHHAGDMLYHTGSIGAPDRNQAVPIGLIAERVNAYLN